MTDPYSGPPQNGRFTSVPTLAGNSVQSAPTPCTLPVQPAPVPALSSGAPVPPPSPEPQPFEPPPTAPPALRVIVRRAEGLPGVAATATLLDTSGRQLSREESDGSGIAEFHFVPGGEWLLVVRHEGYLPQVRTVLLPQQPARTVEVEVSTAAAARLSGTVTNGTGRPVEGALVTLTGAEGAVTASARTAADGVYDLLDLTLEEGTLAVFAASANPVAIPVVIAPGSAIRQDVEVRGSGIVSGIAQTPEGWLIGDARVSLHADGVEIAVTRTDADGRYDFTGLDAGTYTVIAVGYPPAQTEVATGNGQAVVEPIILAHKD